MTHDWTKDAQSLAEAAFAFACTLDEFGFGEIAREMDRSMTWARNRVHAWTTDGLLDEVEQASVAPRKWRVKDSAKIAAATPARTPEENLWTAMRQLKSFSPRILAAHATTETVGVSLDLAQAYCRALLGAGFLAVAQKAVPGRTEPVYRLIRNTGPRPPREKRVRAVIDANTEQVIVIGGGL